MCIDHLSKLGCLFKPCTCAAPERIIRSAIHLIVARLHRSIINAHSLIRIIVGENMIKQYILIIIYFFNLTIITEQPFRQTATYSQNYRIPVHRYVQFSVQILREQRNVHLYYFLPLPKCVYLLRFSKRSGPPW